MGQTVSTSRYWKIVQRCKTKIFPKSTPTMCHTIFTVIFTLLALCLGVLYKEKYLQKDIGTSESTIGIKHLDYSLEEWYRLNSVEERAWDPDDLILVSPESQSLFLTTTLMIQEQTQGECPENGKFSKCFIDSDCLTKFGEKMILHHGRTTGKCNRTTFTCQIQHAWCPVFNFIEQETVLRANDNFTLEIHGQTHFREINEKGNFEKIWTLSEISKIAQQNGIEQLLSEDIISRGGIIFIQLTWTCRFYTPFAIAEPCSHVVNIQQLDLQNGHNPGHRVRYTDSYFKGDKEYRRLRNAYGIQFILKEHADGGKLSFIEILLNFGAALSFFRLFTFIVKKGIIWCLGCSRCRRCLRCQRCLRKWFKKNTAEDERTCNSNLAVFENPDGVQLDDREAAPLISAAPDDDENLTLLSC